MTYKYIARMSTHKGHEIIVLKWGRGKILAYCIDCDEDFIGIRRCIRK